MSTVRRTIDTDNLSGLSESDRAALDALTSDEIERNALTDRDNPPMSEDELSRAVFGRAVRRTRETLDLSQREFAMQFSINLRRLQDWEQGRIAPDSVTLAYLKLIERAPDMVRRILEAA